MTAANTLTCQKSAFRLPVDLHYLNCAYMSPMLRAVEEAGINGIRAKRNPASVAPADFFEVPELVRSRFAKLINAPRTSDVALVPAASYGLAVAAANASVVAGQNIVVLKEQFPSNIYSWRRLCGESGADLRVVGPPSDDQVRGRGWNERLLEAVDSNTAVVALPHVHWTDGTLFDLAAVRATCDRTGALLVIDGTQSVGALPFDVQLLRPDALVCAGYKWLMGPYGYGMAYFSDRLRSGRPLEENWINREGSEEFGGLVEYVDDYQQGALRYDVGERSNFILAPMMLAALDQVLAWGPEQIQDYCQRLTEPLIQHLTSLGFSTPGKGERAAHLFGIRMPDSVSVGEVQEALRVAGVSVSVRGSALRVSPHVYNDASDTGALETALATAIQPRGAQVLHSRV